jgi:hypothetical protein
MCLDFAYKKPYKYKSGCISYDLTISNRVYIGYKVFTKNRDRSIKTIITEVPIEYNKWISCKNNKKILTNFYIEGFCNIYKLGFHIFLFKKDAREYASWHDNVCVRKVILKEIVAFGSQYDMKVIVAKKIIVVK